MTFNKLCFFYEKILKKSCILFFLCYSSEQIEEQIEE